MNWLNILFAFAWGVLGGIIFRTLNSATPFPAAPLEGVSGEPTFILLAALAGGITLVALAVLVPEEGGEHANEPRPHA